MLQSAAKRMASIRAIVNQEKGKAGVATVGIPKLRDDYLIVKVKAVALNPTDWKHIDFLWTPGNRIGCGKCCAVDMRSTSPRIWL
jgi:NADPH:quinone reductase-like Zn-dependent oxidoreductase